MQHGVVVTQKRGEVDSSTNNRMELTAVVMALRDLSGDLTIHTDSTYVLGCCGGLVMRKNIDLVAEIKQHCHRVTWVKVEAHADNVWNNAVDALAGGAG